MQGGEKRESALRHLFKWRAERERPQRVETGGAPSGWRSAIRRKK